jgi:hypothetical protein
MGIVIRRSTAADCPNDKWKKKPQFREQQPDVVAGPVPNSVYLIVMTQ